MTFPSTNPSTKKENKTLLFTSKDISNSSNVVEITSPRKGTKDKIIIPINQKDNLKTRRYCDCLLFFKK